MKNENFDDIFGDDMPEDLKKLIKALNKFKDISGEGLINGSFLDATTDDHINNSFELIDPSLGEPDEVRKTEEGGYLHITKIWNTENGTIEQTVIMLADDEPLFNEEDLNLLLDIAVEDENYEEAAVIRDKIRELKQPKESMDNPKDEKSEDESGDTRNI